MDQKNNDDLQQVVSGLKNLFRKAIVEPLKEASEASGSGDDSAIPMATLCFNQETARVPVDGCSVEDAFSDAAYDLGLPSEGEWVIRTTAVVDGVEQVVVVGNESEIKAATYTLTFARGTKGS